MVQADLSRPGKEPPDSDTERPRTRAAEPDRARRLTRASLTQRRSERADARSTGAQDREWQKSARGPDPDSERALGPQESTNKLQHSCQVRRMRRAGLALQARYGLVDASASTVWLPALVNLAAGGSSQRKDHWPHLPKKQSPIQRANSHVCFYVARLADICVHEGVRSCGEHVRTCCDACIWNLSSHSVMFMRRKHFN